jgi:signal transduction histidine kinase
VLILFLGLSVSAFAQGLGMPVKAIYINGKQSFNLKLPVQLSALDDDLVMLFPEQQEVQYQYFLENYDKSWHNTPYPMVRYTNLQGGEYVLKFKVLQQHKAFIITSIPIFVEHSLTEEWWFLPCIIFYSLLLLGAAIYFFLLYNFREKLKVETIRQKIAADLHDEVGATLSSISIATRVIEKRLGKQTHGLSPILEQIKTDSEDTIQTIRDTVWAINPEHDSVEMLVEKMRSFALQILAIQSINLDFRNEYKFRKSLKMSMGQRRNLYLIYKEAINNIAKHAQATVVTVLILKMNEGFKLIISDNGKGFNHEENHEGNGLKNFQKRADESFMKFNILSEIGKGTTLELLIFEI